MNLKLSRTSSHLYGVFGEITEAERIKRRGHEEDFYYEKANAEPQYV